MIDGERVVWTYWLTGRRYVGGVGAVAGGVV